MTEFPNGTRRQHGALIGDHDGKLPTLFDEILADAGINLISSD